MRFPASPFPIRLALLLALAGTLHATPAPTASAPVPGQSFSDRDHFVEWLIGDLPVVLTAPHGGRAKPAAISDRTEGVLGGDTNTQELTRAVAAEFLRRTGRPPHAVLSLLHRSKLDPNRELKEAAQGDPVAEQAWRLFHLRIRSALQSSLQAHGFAFLVDLHGHAHENDWLELGYGLSSVQLNQSDAALDAAGLGPISTINDLAVAEHAHSFAALLRGPRSFGALLTARGYRAVPSPPEPGPQKARYFNGGYIVRTYGRDVLHVDAVQIEAHYKGVRSSPQEREAFARALVDALLTFLREHYHYTAPDAGNEQR